MRVLFDFELFPDERMNKILLQILLTYKKLVIEYLSDLNQTGEDGAIIIVFKPTVVTTEIMGFSDEIIEKIIDAMNKFPYDLIAQKVANLNNN